jgi:hypothetical protein
MSPFIIEANPGESAPETTRRIQAALDQCAAGGGGTVILSPGTFRCGSLKLDSQVTLHLERGARLVADDNPDLFPPAGSHDASLTANTGIPALLVAIDGTGIGLSGDGTIDGGGDWDKAPNWLMAQGLFRPAVAYFEGCRDVAIESLRIVGARWWTLHLRRCEDVAIRGLSMRSNWPNSDGIDPDGCRNVIISDCKLVCGDDCIVAKSTQGDACENIVITNCILETPCAAFKLGTESLGAFRNISLSNSILKGDVGFALYMKDGGIMENISGTGLIIDTDSAYPILIDAMPRDYQSGKPAGTIRNVQLSHCAIRGPGRAWIEGTEAQPLENIRMESIDWTLTGPLPDSPSPKPLGSARVKVDPQRPAHHHAREQVVAIHVQGLRLADWSLSGEVEGRILP